MTKLYNSWPQDITETKIIYGHKSWWGKFTEDGAISLCSKWCSGWNLQLFWAGKGLEGPRPTFLLVFLLLCVYRNGHKLPCHAHPSLPAAPELAMTGLHPSLWLRHSERKIKPLSVAKPWSLYSTLGRSLRGLVEVQRHICGRDRSWIKPFPFLDTNLQLQLSVQNT